MATAKNVTEGGASGHTPESGHQAQQGQQSASQANQTLQGSQSQSAQRGEAAQRQQGDELAVQGRGGAVQNRRERGLASYGRDPFSMVQQLADEMDQLFGSFFYGAPGRGQRQQNRAPSLWAPELEIKEEGNQLRISADLPGVAKDNVKVEMQDGMLVIQGERREERTEGGEQQGFTRTERRYGSFYRAIPLPEGVDLEQAQAQMKDGVLEITVPLTQKQARRLEIKS
jgi:HSP20 family protein